MDFGLTPQALRDGLIFFILLFAVLILRAFAQAWLADRMGDPTPRNDGRVTLYPPPHIDLLGTIILPLICVFYLQPRLAQISFFLAWTRPVPTNPANFSHPRRGELFTQFAGTAICILIALVSAVVGGLIVQAEPRSLEITFTLIGICAMLIVLDLIPIPPLPGGMLLRHFGIISEEAFWSFSRWGGLVLLISFNIPPVRAMIGRCVVVIASPFAMILDALAR
ncbi:MAG: site-2 protease family protein [Opitutaceae bacterium]